MSTTPEALRLADVLTRADAAATQLTNRQQAAAELRRLAVVEAERDKEKAARQDAQRQLYEERARLYEMVSTERVKTSQALAERDQLRAEVEALRADAATFPKLRAFVQGYSMELWKAFERRNG